MKKNQIRKSVAALAMAVVVGVSLLGYGCGRKSASTAGGVSGDFTGTAKGMGGDVTVTLTLEDGTITGCTAEGKDETPSASSIWLPAPTRSGPSRTARSTSPSLPAAARAVPSTPITSQPAPPATA